MIRRLVNISLTLALMAGCGGTASPDTSLRTAQAETTSTSPLHAPILVSVKYRDDPVDVANPAFQYLDTSGSSVVQGAWYDSSNTYLLIGLSGAVYHYCGVPASTWAGLAEAASRGSYFNSAIKGRYACQAGSVPSYPQ